MGALSAVARERLGANTVVAVEAVVLVLRFLAVRLSEVETVSLSVCGGARAGPRAAAPQDYSHTQEALRCGLHWTMHGFHRVFPGLSSSIAELAMGVSRKVAVG